MMAWLPVVVLAVAQIAVRLIGVAAMIWQQQVCANSHCAQMRTASATGVVLIEQRRDGSGLAIVPLNPASRGGDGPGARPRSEGAPVA
jgi:hypothetical protein